jgi:hypothetical protein
MLWIQNRAFCLLSPGLRHYKSFGIEMEWPSSRRSDRDEKESAKDSNRRRIFGTGLSGIIPKKVLLEDATDGFFLCIELPV